MGLGIREAFSFWTGHPYDFELWVRTGYWVARGLNPYGVIPPAPGVSFLSNISGGGAATIAYLPFWPVLLAGIYDLYALLGSPTPFLYYFLLKQPEIICDIALAFLLYRFVDERGSKAAPLVLTVWLFSPFNILLSGIWGMFESIPILFLVAALGVRPGAVRGAWAGLATFAKSIPAIYAVPLSRGPRPVLNLAVAIGIPLLGSLLIVWLAGWSFSLFGSTIQNTLPRGGLSLSLWEIVYASNYFGAIPNSILGYPLLTVYETVGYVWIVAVGIATVCAYKWFGFDTERGMVRSLLVVTLVFLLARTAVNEQYSEYLFALMLVDVALWSPGRRRLFVATLSLIMVETATNNVLFLRFFAPVYPSVLSTELSIIDAFGAQREMLLFAEAMVFCALNLYYLWSLFGERRVRTEDYPLTRPKRESALARSGTIS